MKTLFIFLTLLPHLVQAIPEDRLEQSWNEEAMPYYRDLPQGQFVNSQGLTLKYRFLIQDPQREALVIVPGQGEPAIKYAELIFDLRNSGLNVFIMDHQGQGESERLLPDHEKGHVQRFTDFVDDFENFIVSVVKGKVSGDTYLIAHSMGGAIATKFLARRSDLIRKTALIAPMFEINTKPYTERIAGLFAGFLMKIGKGDDYAPGKGPYIPKLDHFETNKFTSSPERHGVTKFIFTNYPEFTVGGPTTRWVSESLRATKKIHEVRLSTPLILFQAGDDEIVKPQRQREFCQSQSDCELRLFPEGKHELLMEKDEIRDKVLKEIELFFGLNLFPENR